MGEYPFFCHWNKDFISQLWKLQITYSPTGCWADQCMLTRSGCLVISTNTATYKCTQPKIYSNTHIHTKTHKPMYHTHTWYKHTHKYIYICMHTNKTHNHLNTRHTKTCTYIQVHICTHRPLGDSHPSRKGDLSQLQHLSQAAPVVPFCSFPAAWNA